MSFQVIFLNFKIAASNESFSKIIQDPQYNIYLCLNDCKIHRNSRIFMALILMAFILYYSLPETYQTIIDFVTEIDILNNRNKFLQPLPITNFSFLIVYAFLQ